MNYNYEKEWLDNGVPTEVISFLKEFSKKMGAELKPFKNINLDGYQIVFVADCESPDHIRYEIQLRLWKNIDTGKYEGKFRYNNPIKFNANMAQLETMLINFDDDLNISKIDGFMDDVAGRFFVTISKENGKLKVQKLNYYDKIALEVASIPNNENKFKEYNILPDFTLEDLNDDAKKILNLFENEESFYHILISLASMDSRTIQSMLADLTGWQLHHDLVAGIKEMQRKDQYKEERNLAYETAERNWKKRSPLYRFLNHKLTEKELNMFSNDEIKEFYTKKK